MSVQVAVQPAFAPTGEELAEAFQTSHDALIETWAGQRLSGVQWVTYPALEASSIYTKLGLQMDPTMHELVRCYPDGTLVVAMADVEVPG